MRSRLGAAFIAILTAASACGGSAQVQARAFEMLTDTSGAYPVVTARGDPPQAALEQLGVVRPDAEVGFSRLRAIALDPRGGVWALDAKERTLQHFDDAGRLIGSRGRVGEGPGEFESPYAIAADRSGLLLWDPGLSRATRWTPDGELDASWLWFGMRATGSPVHWYLTSSGPRLFMPLGSPQQTHLAFFSMAVDGQRDTLYAPRPKRISLGETRTCDGAGGSTWFWPSPFQPEISSAPWRGAVAVTTGADYAIALVAPGGDTLRVLRRELPARPVTEADWDSASAEYRVQSDTLTLTNCRGEYRRVESFPSITDLATDSDGRLWVEAETVAGSVWDLWAGDSLVASMPAPARAAAWRGPRPSMLGDRMAVPVVDTAGGMDVVVYRMRGLPGMN
ncbi:MAG TPA: hypothetical protein VFN22_05800 [Gemmatimonadales bacterium]|nr:hypothetical protein [Gemmatimonadales bacterium]